MKITAKILILAILLACLSGCAQVPPAQIAATTAPVWQFTAALCDGTPLTVARLVTESVSCLHDYSLTVRQMRQIESAELIVISGAGLEEFMEDVLEGRTLLDASCSVPLLEGGHHHDHSHSEGSQPVQTEHHHEQDPHIWLSPANAAIMAQNICNGLSAQYPQYTATFQENLELLKEELAAVQAYGQEQLSDLGCRELITFHDGFAYLAQAFDLEILRAIEEESGSEASAQELIELIEEVEHHSLNAVFTEISGSPAAAGVICAETGCGCYALDMAMSGEDYFSSMYHNIDTLKEALQ